MVEDSAPRGHDRVAPVSDGSDGSDHRLETVLCG